MRLTFFLLLAGFVMPPVFAQDDEQQTPFTLGVDVGYRQDRGQWTISGGEGGPNIISDLEWDELEIFELRVRGETQLGPVNVEASFAYGEMVSGQNRDSDYVFDNRQGEFSRSTADTEGDTFDFQIGIGLPFIVSETGFTLTPLIGYSLFTQNHTDTNGFQELDDPGLESLLDGVPSDLGPEDGFIGPFDGLNSTYDAEWSGPYVGVSAILPLGERSRLVGRYQLHLVDYSADLYWNLRDLPFENDADGWGHQLSIAYEYSIREDLHLSFEGAYTSFETDEGIQTDPGGDIELNGAEWESLAVRFGVLILF